VRFLGLTALFDVLRRRWSYELADELGIERSILPKCYESTEVTGAISLEAARLTGLAAGTPVLGGGGDQASSAVGNGIVRRGIVSCTLGTSGVVFAHMDSVAYDPAGRVHTFCHAVPGKWHVMGVTQGAGLSLQWFRNQLAPGTSYDALTEEAAKSPAGAQGLFWLPYLIGERTPHLDPLARAAFVGLTASHTRAHCVRAVLEGVAFSLKDTFTLFAELGIPVARIRLGGGGARSPLWQQIQADIYGQPVELLAAEEGGAYGAALLAAVGVKAWPTVEAACAATIQVAGEVAPRSAKEMASAYESFRRLYPALKQVSEPRKVLIATNALACFETKFRFQASDEPSGWSGPMLVFVMRSGIASAFQAFASLSAIA